MIHRCTAGKRPATSIDLSGEVSYGGSTKYITCLFISWHLKDVANIFERECAKQMTRIYYGNIQKHWGKFLIMELKVDKVTMPQASYRISINNSWHERPKHLERSSKSHSCRIVQDEINVGILGLIEEYQPPYSICICVGIFFPTWPRETLNKGRRGISPHPCGTLKELH